MEINPIETGKYFAYQSTLNENPITTKPVEQSARQESGDSANSYPQSNNAKQNLEQVTQDNASVADTNESSNESALDRVENQSASNEAEVESAIADVSSFLSTQNRGLNFAFDENSDRSVIQVTDKESGDLIRQIPSEEILKLAIRINELRTDAGEAVGVLVNRQV